ncbi:hypothetical protein DSM104299_00137 [Baekduia alba]|nr:hypothetical protein DSM104299_00137 [Baekduia alba]
MVALVAAFALIGVVSQAHAATDGPKRCITGGCVWFTAYGNVVHVQDTSCDGVSAVAQVEIPAAGIYDNLWNSDGCGSTDSYSYAYRFPEGYNVYYRPCVGVFSSHLLTNCLASWTNGVA